MYCFGEQVDLLQAWQFLSEFDLTEGIIPFIKLNIHIHYYYRTRDNNLN